MEKTRILGLDLGTNSIGWAITEENEGGFELKEKGVNIFQEGVNRTKSGEEPMVKTRTDSRALRRKYFRRRLRKIELLKVLIANDMCPFLTEAQLHSWRYGKQYPVDEDFLLWQRTDDNKDKNPYHDRYIALKETLDMSKREDRHLIGRAMYHLSQRRGFLSNRKDADEKNSGEVLSSISALSKEIKEHGCSYLGEYFYELYREGAKIRTKYTARKEHYEAEFSAICAKQNLSDKLRESLFKAIFFHRPLKSQKGSVGRCTFEKKKSRCPVSHPCFEEYRMLSLINNIRIKSYLDSEYRPMSYEEVQKILPLFYRKSKARFDFEEIAKAIAGKRAGCYAYKDDRCEAAYRFNYRMSQSVSACPVTASLKSIFGEDWLREICSLYTKSEGKSELQILNDVWHVMFSFTDDEKLREWAKCNLQLTDEQAAAFVKVRIPQEYAALSLNAINKILPYLRRGYRYDEAVFLANLKKAVPEDVWNDSEKRSLIECRVAQTLTDYKRNPNDKLDTKETAICRTLLDCGLAYGNLKIDRLYHPSMIEIYKEVLPDSNGTLQLGLPFTSSIRNPMAMRSLFRMRALINYLLKEGKIDRNTKINIEFARELNTANMRKAIEASDRENYGQRDKNAEEIRRLYKEQCGRDIEPTEDDLLKYKLWEEQNHICLYTGMNINICDFLGASPKFDIEHTVPRSRGGDNSQMNKTLCECRFNRDIKRAKLPSELANHAEIMARIETLGWEDKIRELRVQIEKTKGDFSTKEIKDRMIQKRHRLKMQLDELKGKLDRFKMSEVPDGFSNRQGVDISIINRYARMFLKSVFERIYIVKGSTTADLRKAWGLQNEYSKKDRVNHVHHCMDAVVIACINGKTYQDWAHFVAETEYYERQQSGQRPFFPKPWPTFTEDVKSMADKILVSHHTADRMPKHGRKKMRKRGKIQSNEQGETKYLQGDTARASLHLQTFYGAIKRDDVIKYVVRKPLDSLQQSDVDKIVDEAIRECVKAAVQKEGFKEAMSKPICFNEKKGVYIKKVRILVPSVTQPLKLKKHRDESRFEYKRSYHVANDSNYCMAIYEGVDSRGKTKRGFKLLNNLEAALYYNGKSGKDSLVPKSDKDGYSLKCILRTGTMVLFYENSPEELRGCSASDLTKRLYKIIGMSVLQVGNNSYGRITFKHHQEARPAGKLKAKNGQWKIGEELRPVIAIYHTQLSAYVEGYDFELTVTGEIKFKH